LSARARFERTLSNQDVVNGAVMLCPMQHTHSFRCHGELYAIGLHVTPSLLTRHALEILGTEWIEFIPQFAVYDPLIHQIGLALKWILYNFADLNTIANLNF